MVPIIMMIPFDISQPCQIFTIIKITRPGDFCKVRKILRKKPGWVFLDQILDQSFLGQDALR